MQPVLSSTPHLFHSLSLWSGFFISVLPTSYMYSLLLFCLLIFLCELSHLRSLSSFVCLCVSYSYCFSQDNKSSACLYRYLSVSVKASFLTYHLYISIWLFPIFTCNGVDSCHHQQDDCGEIEIPAQGHLDEEGSREDISLQKVSTHKSMAPKASRVVAVGVSPTSVGVLSLSSAVIKQ